MDLEGSVFGEVEVVAAGVGDLGLGYGVAVSVWVEVAAGHGVGFVVDEAVGVAAVDEGVDAEGEDVLVVGSEDAWMDDCSEVDLNTLVDGLGAEDSCGADFVVHFSGLVEHEGHDVLVVCDCDDGLEDEFAVADDGGATGAVVCVLPSDASVLLVDANDVGHGEWLSVGIAQD